MNSSEANVGTPLRCKTSSPAVNFTGKTTRTFLSRSSNCQTTNAKPYGHHHHSRILKETNSFHVFPVVKTPPTKRFSKVVNPFEAALTERLHLPLIGSPTLFQRPPTPQHSSTQFAWTIDDVSSLQPANVEPHETQFHESPDPDFEAKAQSAISSYFKEQQIVPSPIDCPLRSQRIILSEFSGDTPISKPGRRIRDNVAQTVLSLPPVLPKSVEAALAPFFFFNEDQQCTSSQPSYSAHSSHDLDHDVRDASLRRKLFDYQGAMYLDDTFAEEDDCVLTISSPAPQSPEVVGCKPASSDGPFHNSKFSDSMDKSSFGSLSPINARSASPPSLKRKSRLAINQPKNVDSGPFINYRSSKALDNVSSPLYSTSPICRFTTPDRSSARQYSSPHRRASEASMDSLFHAKINGLLVDTAKRPKHSHDIDLFGDEAQDVDEDDMQVSQLSALSNNSSESDTPRSKRRSASRKNLSQSFTFQCSSNNDEDNDEIEPESDRMEAKESVHVELDGKTEVAQDRSERSTILCRTDSGFNEMTTSSVQFETKYSSEKTMLQVPETGNKIDISMGDADVSMICCSTPSKHYAIL